MRIVAFCGIMFCSIQEHWIPNYTTVKTSEITQLHLYQEITFPCKITYTTKGCYLNQLSVVREHSLIPIQKYVLLLLTSFNLSDKTALTSLYICTSIPPTKKFVSKYYDMVLGLFTSQKFWPRIYTSYGWKLHGNVLHFYKWCGQFYM